MLVLYKVNLNLYKYFSCSSLMEVYLYTRIVKYLSHSLFVWKCGAYFQLLMADFFSLIFQKMCFFL